jgi:hypothetical protein
MKTQIIAAAILGFALTTSALAAQATGTITAISKKADSITLSDGKTYALPEGIEAETLKVGQKVHVTYSTKAGRSVASKVAAVK